MNYDSDRNKIPVFFIVFIIGILFYFLKDLSWNNWTLMVCKNSSDKYTCDQNKYIMKGFATLGMCRKAGQVLYDMYGNISECGSNCTFLEDKSGDMSCKKLCDRKGCSN